MRHWVVVANAAICRIYETDEWIEVLTLYREITNPRAHLPAEELVSGPRGRTHSGPDGAQSAFDRHTDPREAERLRFAHQVAGVLDAGFGRREWERAILVAPPRFLGQIRAELSVRTARHVVAGLDRDIVHTPVSELAGVIRLNLPDLAGLDLEENS